MQCSLLVYPVMTLSQGMTEVSFHRSIIKNTTFCPVCGLCPHRRPLAPSQMNNSKTVLPLPPGRVIGELTDSPQKICHRINALLIFAEQTILYLLVQAVSGFQQTTLRL